MIEWLKDKNTKVVWQEKASRNPNVFRDCLERAGALNLVPADIKTIAIITEQQIMIRPLLGMLSIDFLIQKKVAIELPDVLA